MAVVNGTAGNDLIHVAGDGIVATPGFTDIAEATALRDTLYGLGGSDLIYGGEGDDLIDGGDGNDHLVGGAGEDTLIGGAGIDTISYGGTVGVYINLFAGSGALGEAHGDVINGIENVQATVFNDYVIGSALANILSGFTGADLLQGQDGNDTLNGGDGDDQLLGNDDNDTISGGNGNDFVSGGTGADRLDGGAGIDTVGYIGMVGVSVDLTTGRVAGGDAQGDVISGFENVNGTSFNDVLTGSAAINQLFGGGGTDILGGLGGSDRLFGDSGDDILRGGAGADMLDGDAGIDLISFYGAAASVRIYLSVGTGSGGDAEGDTYVGIENVNGGRLHDYVFGSVAANVLAGFEGNDDLIGYDGNDRLLGGDGDDRLAGSAGADGLEGGAGIDVLDYYTSGSGVTVDLTLGVAAGGDAQGDVFSGIENVEGASLGGDALTGSGAANRLIGHGGNDLLNGLGGSDFLDGGGGDDTLRGGDGDDFLHVGAGADVMDGGAGRDTMVLPFVAVADWQAGMLDADIATDSWLNWEAIQGSSGNDIIRTNSWGYALELRGGAGNDVLAAGVDGATADTLSGEAGNDQLNGGAGNDLLRGGAGADALVGASGTDTASYYGGTVGILVSLASGIGSGGEAQGDTLSGIENLSGSQGSDSLYGNGGGNVLQGWNGNDLLVGRAGRDTLTGGAGSDRFQFTTLADSVIGANADRITDFSHAQGDRIDLAAIDARFTVAGNQAFSFIGTAGFTGVAGQLHYWHDSGRTIVSGDVNGNRTADFNIVLTGTIALVAGDFVL